MSVNSKLNHDDFLTRLKLIIGNEKPFGWAKRIGIPTSSFSTMWNDGVVPKANTLLCITSETGVSIDWLLTGEGPMRRGEAATAPSKTPTGAEQKQVWSEGGWEEADINIQQLLNMTAEVLVSDTVYRPALAANIKAFRRAIDLENDNRELRGRVETLESRLAALEQRINQKKQAAA